MASANPNPGGTVVVRVRAKKADGTYWTLTGSTIRTELVGSSLASQSVGSVVSVDTTTRDLVVSTTQTESAAGTQLRLRYWISPADSFETVDGETLINVRPA